MQTPENNSNPEGKRLSPKTEEIKNYFQNEILSPLEKLIAERKLKEQALELAKKEKKSVPKKRKEVIEPEIKPEEVIEPTISEESETAPIVENPKDEINTSTKLDTANLPPATQDLVELLGEENVQASMDFVAPLLVEKEEALKKAEGEKEKALTALEEVHEKKPYKKKKYNELKQEIEDKYEDAVSDIEAEYRKKFKDLTNPKKTKTPEITVDEITKDWEDWKNNPDNFTTTKGGKETISEIEELGFTAKFKMLENGKPTFENTPNSQAMFAYNPDTMQVLPRKEGWNYATDGSGHYFEHYYGQLFNIPEFKVGDKFEDFEFTPATLHKDGSIVKGDMKRKINEKLKEDATETTTVETENESLENKIADIERRRKEALLSIRQAIDGTDRTEFWTAVIGKGVEGVLSGKTKKEVAEKINAKYYKELEDLTGNKTISNMIKREEENDRIENEEKEELKQLEELIQEGATAKKNTKAYKAFKNPELYRKQIKDKFDAQRKVALELYSPVAYEFEENKKGQLRNLYTIMKKAEDERDQELAQIDQDEKELLDAEVKRAGLNNIDTYEKFNKFLENNLKNPSSVTALDWIKEAFDIKRKEIEDKSPTQTDNAMFDFIREEESKKKPKVEKTKKDVAGKKNELKNNIIQPANKDFSVTIQKDPTKEKGVSPIMTVEKIIENYQKNLEELEERELAEREKLGLPKQIYPVDKKWVKSLNTLKQRYVEERGKIGEAYRKELGKLTRKNEVGSQNNATGFVPLTEEQLSTMTPKEIYEYGYKYKQYGVNSPEVTNAIIRELDNKKGGVNKKVENKNRKTSSKIEGGKVSPRIKALVKLDISELMEIEKLPKNAPNRKSLEKEIAEKYATLRDEVNTNVF